jgi:hypothetical protein
VAGGPGVFRLYRNYDGCNVQELNTDGSKWRGADGDKQGDQRRDNDEDGSSAVDSTVFHCWLAYTARHTDPVYRSIWRQKKKTRCIEDMYDVGSHL